MLPAGWGVGGTAATTRRTRGTGAAAGAAAAGIADDVRDVGDHGADGAGEGALGGAGHRVTEDLLGLATQQAGRGLLARGGLLRRRFLGGPAQRLGGRGLPR